MTEGCTDKNSSKLTDKHYDINFLQNTSIDILCSNFRQINDNVVTEKYDVSRNITVSDMRLLKYFSPCEIVFNSPETLADGIINPSDQVVNTNHPKDKIWTT